MTQEQVAVTAEKIRAGKTSLGIEFGSTRIKAVLIDDAYHTIAAGDYEWASHLEDGLWSYTQEEIWKGLQTAYARMAGDVETAYGERLTHVGHIGFSAMMHGYLAFDKSGELLVPFRTWQNTNTHEAHEKLSELFQYNIPERWSVAHLYQAVLNHEEHVSKVDYITTLAGYVHWKLTGEKVLGVGDASGMFPIDPTTHAYETEFIEKFNALPEVAAQPWKLADLLPKPLVAGTPAGTLTAEGVTTIPVANDEEGHKKMEEMLNNHEVDGAVTMHYPFPIGVSTVGRAITPAKGREMFIANTTGTSSSDRIEGMIKNAVSGIITAKACGVGNPMVGILNVDGARQTEMALNQLKANGYEFTWAESARADGGAVMRGNDVLEGLRP